MVPTKVMALSCVAITESPAAHQRISRPARKKSETLRVRRPTHTPSATIALT